jgi:hypothetical protein
MLFTYYPKPLPSDISSMAREFLFTLASNTRCSKYAFKVSIKIIDFCQ